MESTSQGSQPSLAKTPLHALHLALGAKMVPFAGYDMPVQYPTGIIAEHLHTRSAAGLFDVSHMGQAVVAGKDAARRLESLVPADLLSLDEARARYTQLLNPEGNILDDLMVTRLPRQDGREPTHERLYLVVNAARKEADFAHIRDHLGDVELSVRADHALLALQGPAAARVLAKYVPGVAEMPFMSMRRAEAAGHELLLWRSGYTGEDGFEISVPAGAAERLAKLLLAEPEVKPIGLGARDTLRLEAGLCLYGHDIDETTTPIEAGLAWSIGRRRRVEGGFPGDERVRLQLAHGPPRRRVGLRLGGRAPAREGSEIESSEGVIIGKVTSGGFSPSLGAAIAMGYVQAEHAAAGSRVHLRVRGKGLSARIVDLPFVAHRYFKGK